MKTRAWLLVWWFYWAVNGGASGFMQSRLYLDEVDCRVRREEFILALLAVKTPSFEVHQCERVDRTPR